MRKSELNLPVDQRRHAARAELRLYVPASICPTEGLQIGFAADPPVRAHLRVAPRHCAARGLLDSAATGLRSTKRHYRIPAAPHPGGRENSYGQGLLWRVDQADAPPSYLFGTAHSKDPRVTRLAEPVAATFETARSLTIEVVRTPEFDRAVERSIKIQGSDVEPLVGPERLSRIRAAGARYGLQLQALRQLKPWALYVLFSLPPAEVQNSRRTLDFALQDSAEERGIPIYGLESVEEQLGVFTILILAFKLLCSTWPSKRTGGLTAGGRLSKTST
jgi:hypothetical protein